jgi:hypothetical protein
MKYALTLSILAALLGGCAIGPAGYGDNRDGYYQDRSYYRSDGYYRDRNYNSGDRYYRDSRYPDGYINRGEAFRDHGS